MLWFIPPVWAVLGFKQLCLIDIENLLSDYIIQNTLLSSPKTFVIFTENVLTIYL